MNQTISPKHHLRVREKYNLPPEIDIPGATLRLFNQGKAIDFLNSDEHSQLRMLRQNISPEEERVVMLGVRKSLSKLLESSNYYNTQGSLGVSNKEPKRPFNTPEQNGNRPSSIRVENYRSAEIEPALVGEVSNFYRWIFGNTMHYAVCSSCESEGRNSRMSAQQVFGLVDDNGKPTGKMVDIKDMDESENLPNCPCCKNKMDFVYDPETLEKNFDEKLRESEDSYLSLLRRGDGNLAGLAFSYITNLSRELRLEWGNKFQYSADRIRTLEHTRSKERFLACVDQVFPDTKHDGSEIVLAWNCISIAPDASGKMMSLTHDLFNQIPEDRYGLNVLGDVKKRSVAHRFFRRLKGNDGTKFFETDDEVLIGGNVGVVANVLNSLHRKKPDSEKKRPTREARQQITDVLEGGVNPIDWDKLAEQYDKSVYSITSFPEKRERIINSINDGDNVLIAGCGSATYLQESLLNERDVKVTASDFSRGMIDIARQGFNHSSLKHKVCDTKNLPFKEEFDAAISTNSIIPPHREDVVAMYQSIFESLKPGGKLIAYLPSFTLCTDMLTKHPELKEAFEGRMDYEQSRFKDTVGWQCFHTTNLIMDELKKAGFDTDKVNIETVKCESDHEASELGRLYGLPPELIGKEFACLFVKAEK